MGRKGHPWGFSMPSARHEILILTKSGSMSLLPQMASNPLTMEGATALLTSVRKNPKSMMEEINISVRAYVLESLQDHTLHIFRNWVDHRAAPFQNCFETCCLYHLCTAINKKRLLFDIPSRSHMEIIALWFSSWEVPVVSSHVTAFHFATAEQEQGVNSHWWINSLHPWSCLAPG